MSFQKLINFNSINKSTNLFNLTIKRNLCSSTNNFYLSDGKWNISIGLLIQRFPLIVPDLNIIEKSLHDYNLKLEYEKSLLSDYDYAINKVRNENSKKEQYLQLVSNYDRYKKEADAFKFGGKKTDADLTNNLKSHQRCLDKSLFLITKLNFENSSVFTVPFTVLKKDDQSLREAGERLLEQLDNKSKFRIIGNSPFTYYTYKYPSKLKKRQNAYGNKLFYFKCQLIDVKNELNLINKELFDDYKWLTIDECKNELSSNLWKKLKFGLLDENLDDLLLNMVNEKLNTKKIELSNT